VWEKVNGRALRYPPQRYERAIFTEPAHFMWVALAGQPGVSSKLLGVFTERQVKLAQYRLEPGARLALEDGSIYFVTSGAGSVGDSRFETQTTIYLAPGETATATATQVSELLQLGLPRFT
jgi:hypothetical protein